MIPVSYFDNIWGFTDSVITEYKEFLNYRNRTLMFTGVCDELLNQHVSSIYLQLVVLTPDLLLKLYSYQASSPLSECKTQTNKNQHTLPLNWGNALLKAD